jgi:peptide/nickel transport system substrate-binding protein
MRFKTPLAVLTTAGLMALAACGGSSDTGSSGTGGNSQVNNNLGNTGSGQDPTRKGPITIDGATKGGTVTVLTNTGLTTTLDPTEAYYTDTTPILSDLVTRSLTQYSYDPKTKQMILVPDLATDLGQHNSDYTQWKFTIRDGVKWENGDPVTAAEVGWGITRSFDRTTFATGANYSNQYFKGGEAYKGPYSSPKVKDQAVSVSGNTVTIEMSKPFPDMPYWGAFPAMGAIPLGKASDPAKYRLHPWSDGPYMFKQYTPAKTLTLVRNPNWDPTTDPARTDYPDSYVFKSQTPNAKTDQILLADTGDGQTTLTYDDVQSSDYTQFKSQAADRLVLGGSPCTYYWAPDNRKVTDINVRKALAWAYPYKDAVLAGGLIAGVTAIPATNLMPPGTPGRTEYNPLPGHQPFQTDAAKAKALLKAAGKLGYTIKFLFRTDDPISVQGKDVIVRALTAAGFDPQPVASTIANYVADRDNINKDINVRSAGWCSDWPSGASWFPPVLQSTNLKVEGFGTNYAAFNSKPFDAKIASIQQLPVAQQPAAWNTMDKSVMTDDFPLFTTFYTGIAEAHGSRIQGHYDDTVFGAPTYKDIYISK